jgi:hypothetical protein
MRRMRALATLAFAAALGARAASGADFEPTTQQREVAVAISVTTLECWPPPTGCIAVGTPVNHADGESAPDFAPFTATAAVPGFDAFAASQSSSLAAGAIEAQGSSAHAGSGAYTPPPPNLASVTSGSSDSSFEVAFDVDAPTPVRLSGKVSASGGLSANTTARIRLRTAGGSTLAEVTAASDPACQLSECATVGPLPLEATLVLAPGSYVLEASSAGNGAPFYFANNFYPVASSGAYEVWLAQTAVPALGPGALASLALALLAAAPVARAARRPAPGARAGCRAACARAPAPRARAARSPAPGPGPRPCRAARRAARRARGTSA